MHLYLLNMWHFIIYCIWHYQINEGTEVEANIEDYYVHEEFRKGHRMNNDIALVLLKGLGIPLGKDIMPICLPPENIEYSPGLNCTISGFGSIETGKTSKWNIGENYFKLNFIWCIRFFCSAIKRFTIWLGALVGPVNLPS